MPFPQAVKSITAFLAIACAFPAWSAWQSVNSDSAIRFISIKKNSIAETHHFKQFSVRVNDSGKVDVEIDLTSVATGIDIRDTRMQEMLFLTDKFPKAVLTATLPDGLPGSIVVGEMRQFKMEGKLALHGQSQVVTLHCAAIKLNDNRLLVTTTQPALIQAEDFELLDGIGKLQEVAGLDAIASVVPVSFVLTMEQVNK
ncbi:YceI family protein [Thalassotalea mangrovi]|uniref:YceI family protein n=1 Tax=Thalassotalea mangrovi TaxID=2572245 RepID=A0A4U1B5S4_9GAMM|nr:YceI family protein [Thalassotalea mangrovi]TKB45478.1 YceI family protein [Thalassotalea mangrovi]